MMISDEQAIGIVATITNKGIKSNCHLCNGVGSIALFKELIILRPHNDEKGIPQVMTYCSNCGHANYYCLPILDPNYIYEPLLKEELLEGSGTNKCEQTDERNYIFYI